MTSSTSSSDRRARVPWGLVWCLGFFVAVELGVRMLPIGTFLVIDQHRYSAEDTLDYVAVDLAIELLEAPDVAILGTSRGREGLQPPMLVERLGGALEVRNYSVAGGRVDVWIALLDRLIAEDKLPPLLVVAVDASDFRDLEPAKHRFRLLDLATLPDELERNGWPSERDLTQVIGNSIPLRLVHARPTARYRIEVGRRREIDLAAALAGNSAYGGESGWARQYAAAGDAPPKMTVHEDRVRRNRKGYRIEEPRLAQLRELVARATAHGVKVVLAELPVSPPVRDDQVDLARERLRVELHGLDALPCVWSWTFQHPADDDAFTEREFRDPSHLNRRGADRLVERVAPVIAEAVAAPPCRR